MQKRRKLLLIICAALCCVAIALGIVWCVRAYRNSRISFTVNDTLPDGQGKKATVILLGGQSNAAGCSRDEYLKQKVSAEQYAAYENGYDNVYINYFATGTNVSGEFVKCGARQGEAGGFFGPELGMAEKLNEQYPDRTFFIIKYTWSGSNLHEQWLSPSSKGKTGELYKQFVAYVTSSIDYLISKHYDVEIEGMCWMQGESDAYSAEIATDYAQHLTNLIGDLRKRFAPFAADDGIAFVDAYIAENPTFWVHYEIVNRSKKSVADADPMCVVADTVAEGLTCGEEPTGAPDLAHYDALSELKLGHLFIENLAPFME